MLDWPSYGNHYRLLRRVRLSAGDIIGGGTWWKQRRSQVSLVGGADRIPGGADRIPGGGNKPQYLHL